MNESQSAPQSKHSAADVIRTLVAANGRLSLAAERLGIGKDEVLSLITDDQASLAEQFRSAYLVELFNMIQLTQIALIGNLDRMSTGDIARLYGQLGANFASITAKPTEDGQTAPIDLVGVKSKFLEKLNNLEERTG